VYLRPAYEDVVLIGPLRRGRFIVSRWPAERIADRFKAVMPLWNVRHHTESYD